jgi:hypothetical protein
MSYYIVLGCDLDGKYFIFSGIKGVQSHHTINLKTCWGIGNGWSNPPAGKVLFALACRQWMSYDVVQTTNITPNI